MRTVTMLLAGALLAGSATSGLAAESAPAPTYDPVLAKRLGADERGMRAYVVVILKTGPTPVTDEAKRKQMFAGHFANIGRLAKEGKLATAGPFGKNDDGWRGLYIFAVATVEEARALAETDPVIVQGEMVAEYHPWYGPAAAMLLPELHETLTPPAK